MHLLIKEPLRIIENKLVSPLTILKRFYRVFGLSATFGGQQGIAQVLAVLPGSFFIQAPAELKVK